MGKHEENELRSLAEASIADAERTSTIAGMAAVAHTLLYVGGEAGGPDGAAE